MLQLLNGTFCSVTNGCHGNGLLSDEKKENIRSHGKNPTLVSFYHRGFKSVLFCSEQYCWKTYRKRFSSYLLQQLFLGGLSPSFRFFLIFFTLTPSTKRLEPKIQKKLSIRFSTILFWAKCFLLDLFILKIGDCRTFSVNSKLLNPEAR